MSCSGNQISFSQAQATTMVWPHLHLSFVPPSFSNIPVWNGASGQEGATGMETELFASAPTSHVRDVVAMTIKPSDL